MTAPLKKHPGGEQKPGGLYSRSLLAADENYSVSERERLAIFSGIEEMTTIFGERDVHLIKVPCIVVFTFQNQAYRAS